MTSLTAGLTALGVAAPLRQKNEYAQLKQFLRIERGVFQQSKLWYALNLALLLALLSGALVIFFSVDSLALLLVDAVFLAFIFTQFGYMGHDSGHRQMMPTPRQNDIMALPIAFLVGTSASWWLVNHNLHHRSPNSMGIDPHTSIPLMAFSQGQLREKGPFLHFLARFQAFYYFPMLLFEGFGIHLASVLFLTSGKVRYPLIEGLSLVVHATLYLGIIFSQLTLLQGGLFILVHQTVMGFYMGSVFAPNHKGMMVIEPGTKLDFLREQVLTTRNLRPHPVTDYLYGGLNYQIEHHLFPNLPRRNLKLARPIVKQFCAEHGITYHETSVIGSYLELTGYLHQVARRDESNQPPPNPQVLPQLSASD